MLEINFHNTPVFEVNQKDLLIWLEYICKRYDANLNYLELTFCSDSYLLEMNNKYLQHDYLTDILTFDLNEKPNPLNIQGELYISMDRVRDNALDLKISWMDELHRVIVHGLLHLIGFNDTSEELKLSMRKEEDVALALRMF